MSAGDHADGQGAGAPAVPSHRFDRDTAVSPLGDGAYAAHVSRAWWVGQGPNGGYVAAIVLRALAHALADPSRPVRSLTVHYVAAPREGDARLEVQRERTGRSVSTLSARMIQDERLVALALAAFGGPYGVAVHYDDAPPPAVAPPEALAPVSAAPSVELPAFAAQVDYRPALGAPPFSGGSEALAGGWLRLAEPRPLDALALALYCDAWWPAPFGRLQGPAAAPTLDLTIHFRAALDPTAREASDDFVLGAFRSRLAREGYFEEDGELWSRDGVLLAHSRQLALLLSPTGAHAEGA